MEATNIFGEKIGKIKLWEKSTVKKNVHESCKRRIYTSVRYL